MRVRNSALPLSRVEIDTKGDKTVVTLWDGNYTEENDTGEGGLAPAYSYEIYQLEVKPRSTLAEDRRGGRRRRLPTLSPKRCLTSTSG